MSGSRVHNVEANQNQPPPAPALAGTAVQNTIDCPVVGIGASAGGLEACSKLLDALHGSNGKAFIFVQHLEPTHASLLVSLLSKHSSLTVLEAADGMRVEADHLYIIPPASLLTMRDGALHVAATQTRQGARLPFDALLQSMALACGQRAACIVLSGTGTDGSAGLLAIKQHGGFVVAQEPGEADYSGMPSSAIATGAVDKVLPLADVPEALTHWRSTIPQDSATRVAVPPTDLLPDIIALLSAQTPHDFSLYKPGTLRRRVERRMAMAAIRLDDVGSYVTVLKSDPAEVESLARDLLIHVTGFFRDPAIFELLASTVIPELIAAQPAGQALRVWVAGCSTGEEAYSLAILFLEQLEAARSSAKLQIFASDTDPQSVAFARDGCYPTTIAADVGAARLARFFVREDHGYSALPELRATVVFTVQDLLTDPPFARIDFISCRNVLIYLGAEAQRKIISLFHFALRSGGLLLLGHTEGIGAATDRFESMSKAARLFRHIGRKRPGDVDFSMGAFKIARLPANATETTPLSRQAALAALCQRHALATHGPATVLSNRQHECLYSLGPVERYLRMAPGHATLDILAMVPETLRPRLRSAILRCIQDNAPVTVVGGTTMRDRESLAFNVEIYPVENDGENLLLIYFIDQPAGLRPQTAADTGSKPAAKRPASEQALAAQVTALERQLKTTQAELAGALHSLETSGEEQKSISENALATHEEFQATNEELLTSKEELQSLNEELTALNSQLQETLEQQRTTSADLQNVLYSTDVATLFLDTDLRIRLFTPATKSLFHVIKTDIGRPLEDLRSLTADAGLAADAREVLRTRDTIEREIETPTGAWCRRILPYRTHDNQVEGVVITFTDITQQRLTARTLEAAKREAETATAAKSRFLAAASHDLRQPLQTLSLLQGLLASRVKDPAAATLVGKVEDTVASMSRMLNALLDINQIEAGVLNVQMTSFDINDVLDRLRSAFSYDAAAKGLAFRVMPCSVRVETDASLLKQMLRNLVSNALKYTESGGVLLGCRRRGSMLRIEVWDTGIGIPHQELGAIFDEYHQINNPAGERDRGLGLGLSIVRQLGVLLRHRVHVASRPGKGSVFSIEVPVSTSVVVAGSSAPPAASEPVAQAPPPVAGRPGGRLLVVEDDADLRDLLTAILGEDGHHADAVRDGPAALTWAASIRPDLVITDYNLPGDMDGLAVVTRLREALGPHLPVIVLTGDITTGTLKAIAGHDCRHLSKPVRSQELTLAVRALLPEPVAMPLLPAFHGNVSPGKPAASANELPLIAVVDDDRSIREVIRSVLEEEGLAVQDFASAETFLASYRPGKREGCLLIDAYLPGMGGLELLQRLRAAGDRLPAIMITGGRDALPIVVEAMKAGASDFIEKPITAADLLASIARALERARDSGKLTAWQDSAAGHIADLTPRQHQIMEMVLAGQPSKNIAADLGISQRTVENHRASIMRTTQTRSLPELARLALAAAASKARTLDQDGAVTKSE
jgi:two-component system CheB/CheR fusion protein